MANRLTLPQISFAVVGVDFPNKNGPTRRFEVALCKPGEAIELRPEPRNPADPRAVAVYSERGVQIGYLTAERCGRIGRLIRQDVDVRAVFQKKTKHGAIIRVAFDESPVLPEMREDPPEEDVEFWPDPEWPEHFSD